MSSVSRSLAVLGRLVTAALLSVAPAALSGQATTGAGIRDSGLVIRSDSAGHHAESRFPIPDSRYTTSLTPLFRVPWGTSIDSLRGLSQALGWEFVQIDGDGDYAFRTRIDGEDAMVFATFGTNGLTRVLVSITPHPAARVTYDHVADTLRHHFGAAVLSSHDGQTPTPPASSMLQANAWHGVLLGLRRDGRIIVVLTCPESSPKLPSRFGGPVT